MGRDFVDWWCNMAKVITLKKKPFHRKQKKASTPLASVNTKSSKKLHGSNSIIDVTKKSQITVIMGDHRAQQSALTTLKSELTQMTVAAEHTIPIENCPKKSNKQKIFGFQRIICK